MPRAPGGGRADLSAVLAPDERAQETEIRRQADLINSQMMKEGVENQAGAKRRFAVLRERLHETDARLQILLNSLYTRHPGLAQKRIAKTINVREVGAFLPSDTALLDYLQSAPNRIELFVVTTHSGKADVRHFPIEVRDATLQNRCASFRSACGDPRRPYRDQSRSLYRLLIAPADGSLVGKKRLVVCPDGPLWDVPFQALLDRQNRPLWARYELEYAYSATGAQAALAAKGARSHDGLRSALVLADPEFGQTNRFGSLDSLPYARPFDTPSRPFDTPSRPFDTPSRPFDTPSRPFDTPSRRIGSPPQVFDTLSRRGQSGARPFDTPSRRIGSPPQVFDTLSRRGQSGARPFDTPSRPFDTPSRQMEVLTRGDRITPLPGTQKEAETVRQAFPDAVVYTGNRVQESAIKAEAGRYRYLHFATHGFLNDASPMLSAIVMAVPEKGSSDDGFLTARELFEMQLHADMTVLSACNTGRGQKRTGEGMVGLTWALFVAGCPTQVVSQWSVNDTATAKLMTAFYRHLRASRRKGEALRLAALSLRRERRFAHPYYWSPFILVGNWD